MTASVGREQAGVGVLGRAHDLDRQRLLRVAAGTSRPSCASSRRPSAPCSRPCGRRSRAGSAAASNSGDDGGIGPVALAADIAYASSMMRPRSMRLEERGPHGRRRELRVARSQVEQDGRQRRARIAKEAGAGVRRRARRRAAARCPRRRRGRPPRKSAASLLGIGVEPELDAGAGTAAGATDGASAPGVDRESVGPRATARPTPRPPTALRSAAATSEADVVGQLDERERARTRSAGGRTGRPRAPRPGRRPAGAPGRWAASAPAGTRRAASAA